MDSETLLDIEQIRQLKARYFRTMDQKDWDAWEDVFCEDVHIDTTQEGSPIITDRKSFRDYLSPILQNVQTVHHGHSSEIAITGPDKAAAVWAMEDMLWWPEDEGGQRLWETGWYYEKYRRCEDGEWRICELVLKRIRVEINGEQVFPPTNRQADNRTPT